MVRAEPFRRPGGRLRRTALLSASRALARAALVPLTLAACAAQEASPPEDSGPVPVALRLTLGGETGPVLGDDSAGQLALARRGADGPVTYDFTNGVLAVHELDPGRYEVVALGPLHCRGLEFEVGGAPRYLGAVDASLVEANYQVALMSRASVVPSDVAELAEAAGTSPEAVDAEPLSVTETAPCFRGRHGEMTTWEDLTLAEKALLTIGIAGLCAAAVVSGGFCAF